VREAVRTTLTEKLQRSGDEVHRAAAQPKTGNTAMKNEAETIDQSGRASGKPEPKQFEVVVNGKPRTVSQRELSYAQVVDLAFPGATNTAQTIYTVTYKRGEGNKPEGSLTDGDFVKVKDGMIFNVTATDQS
jgi:hypothetical protein